MDEYVALPKLYYVDYQSAIEQCKVEIRATANAMGLVWQEEDLISVIEPDIGSFVFLLKFNPAITVDWRGATFTSYSTSIHSEYVNSFQGSVDYPSVIRSALSSHVRAVCDHPELVRIVQSDGNIIRGETDQYCFGKMLNGIRYNLGGRCSVENPNEP